MSLATCLSCYDQALSASLSSDGLDAVTLPSSKGKYQMKLQQFVQCMTTISQMKQRPYSEVVDSSEAVVVDDLLTSILLRTPLNDKAIYSKLADIFKEAYDNIPLVNSSYHIVFSV